jgi:phosphatidate cytidylyltransferase
MWVRILAAVVGLAVVIPALLWGGVIALDILLFLALVVGQYEYSRMAFPLEWRKYLILLLAVGFVVFVAMLAQGLHAVGPILTGALLVCFLAAMARPGELNLSADLTGRLLVGMTYVPLLLPFLGIIRRMDQGLALLFLALVATWLGDTGAYFAGRTLGKHKMSPRLSPKKTWEGLVGGVILSVGGTILLGCLTLEGVATWKIALLGGVTVLAGVLGDLAESMLKRAFGVKDSGTIMPGHGGILDRVDSLLFAGPVFCLFAWLLL